MKKILLNIKKVLVYTAITILVSSLTGGSLYVGYQHGCKNTITKFHQELIDKDMAQYNNKTGAWEYKKINCIIPTNDTDVTKTAASLSLFDDINLPLPEKNIKKIAKK